MVFKSRESADAVMTKRPHQIDHSDVVVHRSVPNQGSLRNNYENTNLIASLASGASLNESQMRNYFAPYGAIRSMKSKDDKAWLIQFNE